MPLLYVSSGGRVQVVKTNRSGRVTARVRNPIPGYLRMSVRERERYRINRAVDTARNWLSRQRRRAGGY